MADTTSSAGGPGDAANQDTSTGSPGKLNETLDNLRKAVDAGVETQKELVKLVVEQAAILEKMLSTYESIGDSVKNTVAHVDDVRASLKGVSETAKGLSGNLKKMSIEKALNEFKKMREEAEGIVASGKASGKQQLALNRAINECVIAEKELNAQKLAGNKSVKDSTDSVSKLHNNLRKVQEEAGRFATNMNGVKVGRINQAFQNISNIMGKGGDRVSNARLIVQNAQNMRTMHKAKREGNRSIYDAQVENIKKELVSKMPDEVGSDGKFDFDKFSKSSAAKKYAAEKLSEGDNGERGSWFDRNLARHVLSDRFGGDESSGFHRAIRSGGGSMSEGIMGKVEGASSGLISTLGGPVAAISEGITGAVIALGKAFLDHTAKANQEVEKNLGKGGIFTGSTGGAEALSNVRGNLMSWGLNKFNITTERQMAVAQAMQEEGAGLSELSTKQGFTGNPRSVGDVGNIVFKQAREVGLSDVEGTKQVMKMLTNYKMTLTGTQEFFRTIGKDIHAAGISTGKYLQLLDDVTENFDSMGKSIGSVTSLLRLLGSTGTSTYDQMKEQVGSLTNNNASQEQRAFLGIQRTPEMQKVYVQAYQTNAEDSKKDFREGLESAIKNLGMDRDKVLAGTGDMSTMAQIQKAMNQFKILKPESADADTASTDLGGILDKATISEGKLQSAKSDRVNNAFSPDLTGKDEIRSSADQLTALQALFNSTNMRFGEGVADPNVVNRNSVMFSKGASAYGFSKPEDIEKLLQLVGKLSDASITTLKQGIPANTMSAADEEELYAKAMIRGGRNYAPGKAKDAFMALSPGDLSDLMEKNKKNMTSADALSLASDRNNPINKALEAKNKEKPQTQEQKVAEIATATRTIGGLLETINSNLLAKLAIPLMMLVDHFTMGAATREGKALDETNARQSDKIFQQNLDTAKKMADAAKAKNIDLKDIEDDEDGNRRSLSELLATHNSLVDDKGRLIDPNKRKELDTADKDIQRFMAHASGDFSSLPPSKSAAITTNIMKDMEEAMLKSIDWSASPDGSGPMAMIKQQNAVAAAAAQTTPVPDPAAASDKHDINYFIDQSMYHNYSGQVQANQPWTRSRGSNESAKGPVLPNGIPVTVPTPVIPGRTK